MRSVSVASASDLAARAGAAVADLGGNAVDSAVAAVLVAMCTEPGIIAPGAGGFLTVRPSDGDPIVIDAYAEMPGRGLPQDRFGKGGTKIWMAYGGSMHTIVGYGSVATPGAFAGLGLAIERYGELPWPVILEPAIEAIEVGFALSAACAEYLTYAHDVIFGWDPSSHRAVHDDGGEPLREGDIVHIPELADTLRQIAREGPETIYTGELAKRIAQASEAAGGILTATDLAAYEPALRRPLHVELGQWDVATNPPPAIGGACLAAILLLVDREPISRWDEATVERLVRAQRAVFSYRGRRLDPAMSDRAAEAQELLDLAGVGDELAILSAPSTTHTSAVDSDGCACAITVSAGYGSGAMVPGTGFWLNNSLGEIELHASGFHSLKPGTRLLSNMAPTVATSSDGAVLSIGSAGADRITSAISSVLISLVRAGMTLEDAVNHPRLHAEVLNGSASIAYEEGISVHAIDGMAPRPFPPQSMYFGGVQAARWDPELGLSAAADPRRSGGTAVGGVDAGP